MPSVRCAHCAAPFNVPASAVGRTARCAKCRQSFVIRASGPSPVPEPKARAEADDPDPPRPARPRSEGGRDDRDEDDRPRPAKGRRRSGGTRKRKARTGLPKWVWVAGVGGALVLLLGGAVWLIIGLVGGGGGSESVAAAREPAAGPGSWVPAAPVPPADPATWKVTVDPAGRPAGGLRSTFPLTPAGKPGPLAVLFPAPGTGAAAALVPSDDPGRGADWVRLDLKTGATTRIATVPVSYSRNSGRQFRPVLSPSGDRLAAASQTSPGDLILWSAAGELPRIKAPVTRTGDLDWIGFAGEDRLITLAGGKATGWDVTTGQPAYALAAEFQGPLAVSPGGKWVGGFTGPRGFEWFAAADGRPAGRLPLPDGWFDKTRPIGGLAFRPDGKAVAGFAHNIMGDLLIAVWDPADGHVVESLVVPQPHLQQRLDPPTATWAGDRRLVFAGGLVVELDLHTVLCRYQFQTAAPVAGPSPDGRHWRVVTDDRDASGAAKAGKVGAGSHLVAAAVPGPEATAPVEAARQGFLWHPGAAVRAEVGSSVPKEQRGPLLDALAEGLAAKGYRVDPQAKIRVTVNAKTETGKVLGEHVKQVGPNLGQYKVAHGFIGELSYQVTDAAGKPLMATPDLGKVYAADTGGSGREDVWRELREYARGLRFPRLFLRDAGGAFLRPAPVFRPGVDGVAEATTVDSPLVGLDGFKLPTDPPK